MGGALLSREQFRVGIFPENSSRINNAKTLYLGARPTADRSRYPLRIDYKRNYFHNPFHRPSKNGASMDSNILKTIQD